MKNLYSFALLKNKKILDNKLSQDLAIRTNLFMDNSKSLLEIDNISELQNIITNQEYIIIHDVFTIRKKVKTLNGLAVLASKNDVLNFLLESIKVGDIRDLLIIPSDQINMLLQCKDGDFYLYK